MTNISKTWLPDKAKYIDYLDKIYQTNWITNNGPLVRELESRLAKFLNVKNIILVSNGTLALETAYRLLKLEGDVITTPFSFVATTSSLVTNGLTPVFADIDPKMLTLDPDNIEEVLTSNTSAIVPTHIFGNACNVEKIAEIAEKHHLKVVYDAAHAFNIDYKGESILKYGDISILSFHATKLFHTIEGGALIINDDTLAEEARLLINFGIDGIDSVKSLGTNAKMNEFEAAMGLCVLDDVEMIIQKSQVVYNRYIDALSTLVSFQSRNPNSTENYTYFPVLFDNAEIRQKVQSALLEKDIQARRYFYPSLDTLNYLHSTQVMKHSRDVAERVLCLPIYPDLEYETQTIIINCIKNILYSN